jgi:hypothetical protein
MSSDEFNEKYADYLEDNHYGLDIQHEGFIEWLDNKFQHFINIPDFTYSQIKVKFGQGRFYCEGLTRENIKEVEDKITSLKL